MRRWKKLAPWVGVVLVGLAAYGIVRWRRAHQQTELHYDTARVDRGSIIAKVTATGTLSALVTVQVGSQVSGRIQQIFVDFNSPVKKGQVIAKIDPQLFTAALQQARANYDVARGELAKAQVDEVQAGRQLERTKNLAARKLVAQADLDAAQAAADGAGAQTAAARGRLEQAKAALDQAKVNLAYTTIVSPTNGIVISRSVDVGQTVAASLQSPTLFLIAEDLSKMQVDTSVAEADVGQLAAGMKATFTVDAYPNETFEGSIRQIRFAPQTVQNVVTYDAVVDVSNPQLKLKPGMTANVNFIYAEREDVLRLPNSALRFHPSPAQIASFTGGTKNRGAHAAAAPRRGVDESHAAGGSAAAQHLGEHERQLWVLRDGKPQRVQVHIGVTDGFVTELVDGDLRVGDQLVVDVSGGDGGDEGSSHGPGRGMRRLM